MSTATYLAYNYTTKYYSKKASFNNQLKIFVVCMFIIDLYDKTQDMSSKAMKKKLKH